MDNVKRKSSNCSLLKSQREDHSLTTWPVNNNSKHVTYIMAISTDSSYYYFLVFVQCNYSNCTIINTWLFVPLQIISWKFWNTELFKSLKYQYFLMTMLTTIIKILRYVIMMYIKILCNNWSGMWCCNFSLIKSFVNIDFCQNEKKPQMLSMQ